MCRHASMWGFQNRVCPYPEKRNRHSFVNISPTIVIDTSMERSSQVLQHGNPKIWIFFKKVQYYYCWNWILSVPLVSVPLEKKSPWLCQYQSYISNWYINGKVFTSTTTWEPKNLIFFKKGWNCQKFYFVCTPSVRTPRKRNNPGFVNIRCTGLCNISPTLVIDASMERSSVGS